MLTILCCKIRGVTILSCKICVVTICCCKIRTVTNRQCIYRLYHHNVLGDSALIIPSVLKIANPNIQPNSQTEIETFIHSLSGSLFWVDSCTYCVVNSMQGLNQNRIPIVISFKSLCSVQCRPMLSNRFFPCLGVECWVHMSFIAKHTNSYFC